MLNFQTKIEKCAKSTDDAIAEAIKELGLSQDEVEIEIVEEGSKGFLGLGSKEAKIVATVKEPIIYKAKKFLGEIFKSMNLDVNIDAKIVDDVLNIDLSGDKMGIIIGKRGDTLDSLQYLTSLVVNKDCDSFLKVTIDTENYRQKRYDALIALSERLASKVAKTGKKYTLEPMNPYERRIIHANLQAYEEVTTFSVGEDPYRKLVIAPKNPQKSNHFNKKPSYKKPMPKQAESPVVVDDVEETTSFASYSKRETKHQDFESYMQEHTQHNEE